MRILIRMLIKKLIGPVVLIVEVIIAAVCTLKPMLQFIIEPFVYLVVPLCLTKYEYVYIYVCNSYILTAIYLLTKYIYNR